MKMSYTPAQQIADRLTILFSGTRARMVISDPYYHDEESDRDTQTIEGNVEKFIVTGYNNDTVSVVLDGKEIECFNVNEEVKTKLEDGVFTVFDGYHQIPDAKPFIIERV